MTSVKIDKEAILTNIDNKSQAIINMGDQLFAISKNVHTFDMFLIAILNRTINLNKAFSSLVRDKNFIAAAPLVRINIDSLMRMYAARISEYDLHTFTLKVMGGEHVRNMKTNSGQKLTDKYLIDELSKIDGLSWIKDIYEASNSYIHFADSGIFAAQTMVNKEEQTIGLSIGFHDAFIKDDYKLATIFLMDKIIDQIVLQAQIWVHEKCEIVGFDINKLNDIEFLKSQSHKVKNAVKV